MRTRVRRSAIAAAACGAVAIAAFALLDAAFPFPFEALRPPASQAVTARDGTPLRVHLAADERWRIPVPLEAVSPELVRAVIASEDRWFGWHPGVNPLAALRAAAGNLLAGRRVSGASTIPMQLARMAERRPRTWRAKLVESFRALQISWHLPRREILEAYLNLVPQGGNVEGVGTAAWMYFGKGPAELGVSEIALLVALPRAPSRYDPVRYPDRARAARNRVLSLLAERGVLRAEEAADAGTIEVPRSRRRPPWRAPHFAVWVRRLDPTAPRIVSTLDPAIQRALEQQVDNHIARLRRAGIGNAAVVAIENGTRAVRGMVGSADFRDARWAGEVNGALAPRSPGSTLKPFLYAMAIDDGRLIPDGLVLDVPTDFAGYVAENFDGRYRGPVPVREALVHSLNAPAVRLLAASGLDRFRHLLDRGGLETLRRPGADPGLALVLGAGEVRLVDLANLYATLAEGGSHRPLRFREETRDDGAPAPLFSPEAAWLTTEMIRGLRRPDLPDAWPLAQGVPVVGWKTGTSFGHKDAWAVGFSPRFTVGVWVGNPDGRGVKGISGIEHAGPLLFDAIRAIDRDGGTGPPPPALDLAEIEVCADSRALPEPACPSRMRVVAIPSRTRLDRCAIHREIFVERATGRLLAGSCVAAVESERIVVAVDPPEVVSWKRSRGEPVRGLPPRSPLCTEAGDGSPPRIVSPDPATPYRVRSGAPFEDQRIALVARTSDDSARLHWYEDGRLLATVDAGGSAYVAPRPGAHRLVVVDDRGRSDEVTYRVDADLEPAPPRIASDTTR